MLMLPDFRVRQREYLLEISRAITARLDQEEVLRRVLNASVVMLGGQVGLIALRSESDGLFHLRAIKGAESEQIPRLNQLLHEMIEGAEEGFESEFLNDKLREMSEAIDPELRQSIALPLVFDREPLGLLIVFRSYQTQASANDLQILQSFADQAAIAVNNAQMYEKINQESQRLAAILESSADGVMILDAALHILRFNRSLEKMTGWLSDEAIDLHHDEVIVWDRLERGNLQAALAGGWPVRGSVESPADTLYVEGDVQRRDGLPLSIAIRYAPLFTADGRLANIIANVRDITNFRKAQEMQNVFISGISHELKTPVAIIKGNAATLRRDDVTWDMRIVRDYSAVIEEEADRLDDLIQDLLTASKIQAERGLELHLSDVRLDQIAARAVDRFRPQASDHHFILNFPDDFPWVRGDEVRLRQVMDNLISNAIKYSPAGGAVEVGGEFDRDSVTTFVRDKGVGISEAEQLHIFERFYRVDGTLSSKTQGTGLGLYLTKAIVTAHGGDIYVKSAPGQGATFYFTLPIADSAHT